MMSQERFPKGHIIQSSQMLSAYAFYIVSGAVRLYYTRRGREHTISFSFADQFAVVPRNISRRYDDTLAVQFLEPSTLIFIPQQPVRDQLEESGAVDPNEGLLFLNTALLHYTDFLEERVDVMQTLSASERYAWALSRFPRLTECASTTQIASFLGLSKETLYRIKNGHYNAG